MNTVLIQNIAPHVHNDSAQHPLQRCWDLSLASVQADALATALDLNIFGALRWPLGVEKLAKTLATHTVNTGYLLDLLWSMDLLLRHDASGTGEQVKTYQTAEKAQRYLSKESPDYCGAAWLYRLRSLRHFGSQLKNHVQPEKSAPDAPYQLANGCTWANAARGQIGQEQRAVTVAAALSVVARISEFSQAQHLLDLGGGPGWVAIALAQTNPALKGTVFDWPETVAVAQENIDQMGLASRLGVRGGDLAVDDISGIYGAYDFIWCSSVLHFVPSIAQTLAKIRAALRPGGVLVCVHAEISTDPHHAAQVLPYYLPMMMLGRHVTSQGQLAATLQQNGFTHIDSFQSTDFPMAPVQVLVARKEVA